ncbi:uncharacterized protein N7487_007295 [Penicillium crustosum]|uniref:uncharacterized protein n=1 Tax=Penicillium crustosum TaxID=36656 RepID=UPI00239986ED|nr:uncharacterized protein N7487_007295 [Penicillium crustosum]KAJ5401399.1 hypothetical protein N7487_007295 [Penicillium crustosum]
MKHENEKRHEEEKKKKKKKRRERGEGGKKAKPLYSRQVDQKAVEKAVDVDQARGLKLPCAIT